MRFFQTFDVFEDVQAQHLALIVRELPNRCRQREPILFADITAMPRDRLDHRILLCVVSRTFR